MHMTMKLFKACKTYIVVSVYKTQKWMYLGENHLVGILSRIKDEMFFWDE